MCFGTGGVLGTGGRRGRAHVSRTDLATMIGSARAWPSHHFVRTTKIQTPIIIRVGPVCLVEPANYNMKTIQKPRVQRLRRRPNGIAKRPCEDMIRVGLHPAVMEAWSSEGRSTSLEDSSLTRVAINRQPYIQVSEKGKVRNPTSFFRGASEKAGS